MAELASDENELPAMMRLVRREVGEKVRQVRREILPSGRTGTVMDSSGLCHTLI